MEEGPTFEFEFDVGKSLSNHEKHGVDFIEAQELWGDEKRLIIDARYEKEPRFAIIAEWNDNLWTAIYTLRKNKIRLISFRRARHEEKESYHHQR